MIKILMTLYLLLIVPLVVLAGWGASSEGVLDRSSEGSVVLYGSDAFWYIVKPGILISGLLMLLIVITVAVISRIMDGERR